jgi:hypothetical protein
VAAVTAVLLTVIIAVGYKYMHIFSELLDRKGKPRQTEMDFEVLRRTPPEPPLAGSSFRSFNEHAYLPSDSIFTFNVREHYRMLKEQSKAARNTTAPQQTSTQENAFCLSSFGGRDSRGSKTILKSPESRYRTSANPIK